ncbi:hypothetical protein ABZ840_21275 [Streptomyces sp. NPDC047117]|uniref:hypothetical protein n=1 Tax=unclassified Streptomyces TaxID=2593676 RepID=UPI0033D795F5
MTRSVPSARRPLGRSLLLCLSVLLALLATLLVAGCGGPEAGDNAKGKDHSRTTEATGEKAPPGEPGSPEATPLADTDWATVIDDIDCTGAGNEGVEILDTRFADVRGTGVPDAFVWFTCRHQASTYPQQLEVYDGSSSPDAPRRIGVLLSAAEKANGPGPRVGGVSFSGKSVTLNLAAYTPDDPFCCPSLRVERTFTWNGKSFERKPGK